MHDRHGYTKGDIPFYWWEIAALCPNSRSLQTTQIQLYKADLGHTRYKQAEFVQKRYYLLLSKAMDQMVPLSVLH